MKHCGISLVVSGCLLASAACGNSPTGSRPPADLAGGAGADLAGTPQSDMSQSGGDMAVGGGMRITVTVNGVTCYTLATRSANTVQPCNGDVLFLVGANVDLNSAAPGGSSLCERPGPYTSIADVPSTYADCQWSDYIEGALGLAKTGVLLTARDGHHYKWFIVSNTLPTMVFDQAQID